MRVGYRTPEVDAVVGMQVQCCAPNWFGRGSLIEIMVSTMGTAMIRVGRCVERSLAVKLPTVWTNQKQRWEESEKNVRTESQRTEEKN